MTSRHLQCGRFRLRVDRQARPLVMGVLNVTPDSFSDGGQFASLDAALSHAEQMISDGVDIIDIGGESSRPGAPPLSLDEELKRVMPVLYALRDCGKPISVDTYKSEVMHEVLAAGTDMINDIRGFRAPEALRAVKDGDCALCIMHMQSDPQTMQVNPQYEDVVAEVRDFLQERVRNLTEGGVDRQRICIDPGFGFGKTLAHNLGLLKNLDRIQAALDLPLLAGLSRKSMIGALTGRQVEDRLAGSIAAALAAAERGARILRVHDVAATVDALRVWQAARESV
ncbi:MAG: dihydropteroate synthase [Burkholderiales bacterium]|nr:dihydropteroate synthase [Burkholderiales bacterium]